MSDRSVLPLTDETLFRMICVCGFEFEGQTHKKTTSSEVVF